MKRTAFSPHEGIYIQHLKTHHKNDMPVQHYHDAYEIYLQLDGVRYFFYDNMCYTLKRGDMILLKPFDIHYAESREVDYYERYVVNFQPDALKPLLTDSEIYLLLEEKWHSCIVHLNEYDTMEMFGYFERAKKHSGQNMFPEAKLLTAAAFELISRALKYTGSVSAIVGEKVPPQIIAALRYINNNYKEGISLDDVSEAANTSKYYLSRLFRETTGATVFEYIENLRLTRVHDLLINSKMTLDEIAAQTGFLSSVNLSRVFKKNYGLSPRAFRKDNQ